MDRLVLVDSSGSVDPAIVSSSLFECEGASKVRATMRVKFGMRVIKRKFNINIC